MAERRAVARAFWLLLASLWLCLLCGGRAQARVERFAVIIGNDRGFAQDTPLQYAESDASRVSEVLREIGGFDPINVVLLRGERTDAVRGTLIAVNERIRELLTEPDTQTVLFVYYSGHSDTDRLHLGESSFPIRELAQLVRGSAATFRLIVLDSCRSGALTRLKGGRVVPPFELPDERLPGSGMAYLTASAESEDAQESDQLQGSFFTHALLSGLLGAADRDGNGEVVLDEAYHYAYEATLRATSRTAAGTQHPAFRFDLRGQGQLWLTRPQAYAAERANLSFPSDLGFLLLRGASDGAVVAEIAAEHRSRTLSVRPGRYFVRARGPDVMYEGTLDAVAGTSAEVDVGRMQRIEYARLVRKGARASQLSHGPETGLRVRSALPNASGACFGGYFGYGLEFTDLGIALRGSACGGGFEQAMLSASTSAYDVEFRLSRAWDVSLLAFDVGLGGGLALFHQSFQTAGVAPTRNTLAPFLSLGVGLALDLSQGFYLRADVAAETYFLRLQDAAAEPAKTRASFALRPALGAGKHF
jgi:hypothetical protein